jgi:hypothetical protein
MAKTAEQKAAELAEKTELKQLESAQKAEITALTAALKAQGLKSSEVSKIVSTEKKENKTELTTAKTTLKPAGLQTIAQTTVDANGNTVKLPILSQASSAYAGTQAAAVVSNTLQNAYNAYNQYALQPQTVLRGDGSYSGVSLNDMTKLTLNTNANGMISQGSGATRVPSTVLNLALASQQNLGKNFTSDQIGKLKEVGVDAQGNKLFSDGLTSSDTRNSAAIYQQQSDGTYKNIGYSMTTVPPIKEGFWQSDLGKIVKVGGTIAAAYFGQPYLATQLGATAGASTAATIGANAAAGAIIATGANLATGGDLNFKTALMGAAGGAVAGAFQAAAGISELQAASYDYSTLISNGLSPAQAMETIAQAGYSSNVVNGIAQASSTGASTYSAVANAAQTYVDAATAATAASQPGFFENLKNQFTGTTPTTGATPTAGAPAGTTVQTMADGTQAYVDAAGRIVGGVDNTGATFSVGADGVARYVDTGAGLGGPAQLNFGSSTTMAGNNITTFDDGSQLVTDASGKVVGGLDNTGQQFTVDANGVGRYPDGSQLGGTPNTNFGGNLANASDVQKLLDNAANVAAGGAGLTFTDAVKGLLNPSTIKGLLGGIAGRSVAKQVKGDYDANAEAVLAAGERAADMSQFKPVALTTRFGSTNAPQYDAEGRLTGFGYTAASDIAAQRDKLLTLSGQALPGTTDINQATTDYYTQLQALQNPQREQDLAKIRANLAATGRTGLGVGATTGIDGNALAATNPELAAYYNALAQTQSAQALTAQDVAQQRLTNQIATSGTLFGQAKDLETAAQQPMQLGMAYGAQAQGGAQAAAQKIYDATVAAEQAKLTGSMALNQAQAAGLAGGVNAAGGLLSAGANLATDYLKSLI